MSQSQWSVYQKSSLSLSPPKTVDADGRGLVCLGTSWTMRTLSTHGTASPCVGILLAGTTYRSAELWVRVYRCLVDVMQYSTNIDLVVCRRRKTVTMPHPGAEGGKKVWACEFVIDGGRRPKVTRFPSQELQGSKDELNIRISCSGFTRVSV